VVADVVVVGGGFAGLSAALELAQKGLTVVLLEADRIGSGASGRNGGQAIVGYASGQGPFEAQLGAADAQRAWDLSVEAVNLIEQRIAEHGIDATGGAATPTWPIRPEGPRAARGVRGPRRARHRLRLGRGRRRGALHPQPALCGGLPRNTSGHLHPLKYALGLARAAQAAACASTSTRR
jgi:gamma-glutamylputrescine oxidase